MSVYRYTYTGKNNITVDDFISPQNRLFSDLSPITNQDFQRFDDNTGMSNAERIYAVYSAVEKVTYQSNLSSNTLPFIKPGTDLLLPTDRITIEYLTLYGDNQFLSQAEFNTYWSDRYNALISDPNFVQVEKLTREGLRADVQIIHETLRVYIWIGSLNQIFDISPFIRRMNTSKNFDVGSFALNLDPVALSQSMEESELSNFLDTGLDIINVFPINDGIQGATRDFFETFVQYNDLVFLRFETLANETRRPGVRRDTRVGNNQLPGQIWDMIGLVDNINATRGEETTDRTIQIMGRDLMKLLIDDASYFIPTVFRNGSDLSFVYGGNPNEDYFKRNLISGAYQYYFSYAAKSIRDTLGFIVNHLANLQIVNDELFDSYGDEITRRFTVTGADQQYLNTLNVKGIWKIVKIAIDPVLDDRRIADDALANPDGSLLNYVKRICQAPFVEFWGDTNGDQFDFVARQAPLTGPAIRAIVGSGATTNQESPQNNGYINILEKDIMNYSLEFDTRYYSWYQIQAQNVFLGNSDSSSLSVIPIIWLPQFAEKFGNKRYIVPDNYFSSRALKGDEESRRLTINLFAETVLNDLKYIIDINSYLPFTRRGTITLIGDRRIKVGSFVRLAPTDELFYVTGVNNSVTFMKNVVERVTTLTVERGMVIRYINGVFQPGGNFPPLSAGRIGAEGDVVANQIPYSYFNVVDTRLIIDTIIRNLRGNTGTRTDRGIRTNFGVNEDIFDFFVQRQQFRL